MRSSTDVSAQIRLGEAEFVAFFVALKLNVREDVMRI